MSETKRNVTLEVNCGRCVLATYLSYGMNINRVVICPAGKKPKNNDLRFHRGKMTTIIDELEGILQIDGRAIFENVSTEPADE